MSIFIGEWLGTLLLILLGNGTSANVLLSRSKGLNAGWIVISLGWGFAVTVAVYTSGWISGGHLNPAVTLGLTLAGKSSLQVMPFYLLGQLFGAISGSFLVFLAYYPHFQATKEPRTKFLCFSTSPAIPNKKWNFINEIIGTFVLLVGIMALFDAHNAITGSFAAYAAGILVCSIILSLGGPTGAALNPARDLGPRIVHALLPFKNKGSSEWGYAWIPICGPLLGGALGALVYQWYSTLLS